MSQDFRHEHRRIDNILQKSQQKQMPLNYRTHILSFLLPGTTEV